ncbi:single-stranded DNA-binding protein [Nocardia blacklockiae]|uniref:single-stranded DNA-binding protein n=1 Tax=Nocardia blacklockiae TaxID=480036 RepID=UPI0018952360|nr:single-stranded DNA-binding protein [Nocardia blacklockiae]MBF6172070.1 single-stranded DNA-binding protein [Nocardia blacklockiae]
MYEANTAVVGNVITHPVRRSLPSGEQVVSFRMASNARRFDRQTGEWVDNGTLYLTVSCWRRMVEGVDASIRRGDPIIAYGQLRTSEYRTREGADRHDLEMRASALGPDLGRCSAPVVRQPSGNSGSPADVDTEAVRRPADSDTPEPVAATPADAG